MAQGGRRRGLSLAEAALTAARLDNVTSPDIARLKLQHEEKFLIIVTAAATKPQRASKGSGVKHLAGHSR